jgi:hypothetical protein
MHVSIDDLLARARFGWARVEVDELNREIAAGALVSSSLAAATLQELGLPLATDLVGGFQALIAQGHPLISIEPAS